MNWMVVTKPCCFPFIFFMPAKVWGSERWLGATMRHGSLL